MDTTRVAAGLCILALCTAINWAFCDVPGSWSCRDYRITVQNLLADVNYLESFDEGDPLPIVDLLASARQVATPIDLRVPVTSTGMVVGKQTDPVAYEVVARLRHHLRYTDPNSPWMPGAGSCVYLFDDPAAQGDIAAGPIPDALSDIPALDLESPARLLNPRIETQLYPGELWWSRRLMLSKITVVRVAPDACCFLAPLTGAAEVPPVNSNAHGRIWLFLDCAASRLRYLNIATGANVLEIHIHYGMPNEVSRPIAVLYDGIPAPGPLFVNAGATGPLDFQRPFFRDLDSFFHALRNGEIYANIHTREFPSGEIRGQFGAY